MVCPHPRRVGRRGAGDPSRNREKLSAEERRNGKVGKLLYRAMDVKANDEGAAIVVYCRALNLNVSRHSLLSECLDEKERFHASVASKRSKMEKRGYSEEVIEKTLELMSTA